MLGAVHNPGGDVGVHRDLGIHVESSYWRNTIS